MIYTQIIQALSEILQIKYEAKVSGLGKIYINKYSAKILKDSGQIAPPSFKAKVILDKNIEDNELVDFLVNHYQIKRKKANKAIENWVKVCWASKRKNTIKLIGLSESKFKKATSDYYESLDALVLAPNYLSFHPIELNEYQAFSTIEEEDEKNKIQNELTVPIVSNFEKNTLQEEVTIDLASDTKTGIPGVAASAIQSKSLEPIEEKVELKEIPKVAAHLQTARAESTHVEKPPVIQEIIESVQKPLSSSELSEGVRVVPMPKSESPILKWIGRTAILLLLLLGAFYLFLPEGFNNLFSTNIPINQKPGYEKVLSSNKEEIPKHIETEDLTQAENNVELILTDSSTESNTDSENLDTDFDNQTNTSIQSKTAPDFNYKIIIGRFSNELNIKQLKERLDAEGYHYFAELDNGLYTIGVKVKSNASSIHTQLQHFVDYYTWDSYFKRIK